MTDQTKPKEPQGIEKELMDWANEKQHGISACYSGGPGEPYYQPCLDCDCGFSTGRCETWEDAGRAFDEHVKEIRS